jgi:CyaY protein
MSLPSRQGDVGSAGQVHQREPVPSVGARERRRRRAGARMTAARRRLGEDERPLLAAGAGEQPRRRGEGKRPCSRRHYTAERVLSFADFIDRAPCRPRRLSDAADYEARTRAVLARSRRRADRLLQDDVIDIDAGRTGGLLELASRTAARSSSTPSRRCTSCGWRRSPAASLPLVGGRWIDRDGREFFDVLSACAASAGRAASPAAARAALSARNRSRMLLRSSSLGVM